MHAVLKSVFDDLAAELSHFDVVSANVHPHGQRHCWTVRQVVEHLVLSMDATSAEVEKRLTKGRVAHHSMRTRTEWMLQLMMLSAGHMPSGVPAPADQVPAEENSGAGVRDLVSQLELALEQMDGSLDRARQRFGMERVGRHFLLGPLRVDQWRRYHVLHMRQHLKQIVATRTEISTVPQRHSAMLRA